MSTTAPFLRRFGAWVTLALAPGLLAHPALASAEPVGWFATAYGAVISKGDLGETGRFETGGDESYLVALTGGRRLGRLGSVIDWELESQLVKHFGRQSHWECNALIVARWLPFPWDEVLDTSLAVGEGVSFASQVPSLEEERHEHAERLLAYLLFEVAVALPHVAGWSAIGRIHHRSGAWGTFGGVRGASNFWGLGARRDF